jgi:hypothetical protein
MSRHNKNPGTSASEARQKKLQTFRHIVGSENMPENGQEDEDIDWSDL